MNNNLVINNMRRRILFKHRVLFFTKIYYYLVNFNCYFYLLHNKFKHRNETIKFLELGTENSQGHRSG